MRNFVLNASRLLIAILLSSNLLVAVEFLIRPDLYAPAYELQGAAGAAAVRGVGLLFLMWNVPAMVAIVHPARHWISLCQAVAMQVIGLAGESWILLTIPVGHPSLAGSIQRFIWFDAAGLVLLFAAALLASRLRVKFHQHAIK